jgi:hypothetical protein
MHSPTMSALSEAGWYDLDVVIDEKILIDLIPRFYDVSSGSILIDDYNVRDIITHEYKNQSGSMKIEWVLQNMLNPLYWALDLYIVKDVYEIIRSSPTLSQTFMLVDSGNLLGYYRFGNLENQHIMPWDDDFDLGWYSRSRFSRYCG